MDKRLQAVKRYLALPLHEEQELQDFVYVASELCQTPIAAITLVDDKKQYPVIKRGNVVPTPCHIAFCNNTIKQQSILEIPDARKDVRFQDNPLVTQHPYVRFYAGIPLITTDGFAIGSFCVVDQHPKKLSESQIKSLEILSKQAMHRLEMRLTIERLKDTMREVEQNKELLEQAAIMKSAFYDNSEDYFLLLNNKFEIVSFNTSFQNFFFKRNTELVKGRKIFNYIHLLNIPKAERILQKAKEGESQSFEILTDVNGEEQYWINLTIAPTYNGKKQLLGIACIGYNIDREKKQQEKINLQKSMLSQIAQLHAHQIRHPLTNILGIIGILKQQNFEMTEEYIRYLEAASKELDEIIQKVVIDSHMAV